MFSCKVGPVLSAGSACRTRTWKPEWRDCLFVVEESGACSVQDYKKVPCFRDVGSVAGDDWGSKVENAVSATKGEAEKTGDKYGLEGAGDGVQGELYFVLAKIV